MRFPKNVCIKPIKLWKESACWWHFCCNYCYTVHSTWYNGNHSKVYSKLLNFLMILLGNEISTLYIGCVHKTEKLSILRNDLDPWTTRTCFHRYQMFSHCYRPWKMIDIQRTLIITILFVPYDYEIEKNLPL